MEKYKCHDCGKELIIIDKKIKDGLLLEYKDEKGKKIQILKCNDCYLRDSSLKNYQECEVYSRIVGYLRPIKQWNEGKQQEYKERKVFKV